MWPFGKKSNERAEESVPTSNSKEVGQTRTEDSSADPQPIGSVGDTISSTKMPIICIAISLEQRIQLIREHLAEEGFRPTISEHGDIIFKFEGLVYLVECFEDDPAFVRVVLPGIYDVGEDDHTKVLEVCHGAAQSIKAVKAIVGAKVSLVIESFYASPLHFCEVVVRCCSALKAGMHEFDRLNDPVALKLNHRRLLVFT